MNCVKCGTSFCYRCGEAFRSWKAFGDHSSKLSVFGCKYAFLPQKPFCRKLIRGSIFSTRVCAAVFVGTLAIGVGSAAVCVSAAALPFYGAIRLCQKLKRKRRSSIPESVSPTTSPTNCYLIRKIPNISEETEQKGKYLKHPAALINGFLYLKFPPFSPIPLSPLLPSFPPPPLSLPHPIPPPLSPHPSFPSLPIPLPPLSPSLPPLSLSPHPSLLFPSHYLNPYFSNSQTVTFNFPFLFI
ncbi:RNF217 [Acanthosepion pharaonis]|uniref:RNF217 n=1 Tax=Acanthosepion pharaonis TaxID=158019 RepID=A0A812BEQ7_ACAPH|nr:RNF217 [Sepia pharaonis]